MSKLWFSQNATLCQTTLAFSLVFKKCPQLKELDVMNVYYGRMCVKKDFAMHNEMLSSGKSLVINFTLLILLDNNPSYTYQGESSSEHSGNDF